MKKKLFLFVVLMILFSLNSLFADSYPELVVTLPANDTMECRGFYYIEADVSGGEGPLSYNWEFSPYDPNKEPPGEIRYDSTNKYKALFIAPNETGYYTITLTVTDSHSPQNEESDSMVLNLEDEVDPRFGPIELVSNTYIEEETQKYEIDNINRHRYLPDAGYWYKDIGEEFWYIAWTERIDSYGDDCVVSIKCIDDDQYQDDYWNDDQVNMQTLNDYVQSLTYGNNKMRLFVNSGTSGKIRAWPHNGTSWGLNSAVNDENGHVYYGNAVYNDYLFYDIYLKKYDLSNYDVKLHWSSLEASDPSPTPSVTPPVLISDNVSQYGDVKTVNDDNGNIWVAYSLHTNEYLRAKKYNYLMEQDTSIPLSVDVYGDTSGDMIYDSEENIWIVYSSWFNGTKGVRASRYGKDSSSWTSEWLKATDNVPIGRLAASMDDKEKIYVVYRANDLGPDMFMIQGKAGESFDNAVPVTSNRYAQYPTMPNETGFNFARDGFIAWEQEYCDATLILARKYMEPTVELNNGKDTSYNVTVPIEIDVIENDHTKITITGDIASTITDQEEPEGITEINLSSGTGLKTLNFTFKDDHNNAAPSITKELYLIDEEPETKFTDDFTTDTGFNAYLLNANDQTTVTIRNGRIKCDPNNGGTVVIEPDIVFPKASDPYRIGFDMRALTENRVTPEDFLLYLDLHYDQDDQEIYRIFTTDSFNQVRAFGGDTNDPPQGEEDYIPWMDSSKRIRVSTGEDYGTDWVSEYIDWSRWHRVEALYLPRKNDVLLYLYLDGRLFGMWKDTEMVPLDKDDSFIVKLILQESVDSNIKCIDIDNMTIDNIFASKSDWDEEETPPDKHQTFVTMSNVESKMNLGDEFQNDGGVLKPLHSDIPCSITLASPENLHDYNLSLLLSYGDYPNNTTQTIWLRRNYSDYKISLPGEYGDYDFSHEYGYTIHTTDGFEHITVKRVERNHIVDDPIGVDDSQVLVEDAVTSFTYTPDTKLQLHFSIYGDILDIYADWELVCSIEDDTTSAVHFGGTQIVTEGGTQLRIHDIGINTDYYFWSRKGNAFTYRGQEAVPVGFNTFYHESALGSDLYECLTDEEGIKRGSTALDDLKERMKLANQAGARILRTPLWVGYVVIENDDLTTTGAVADAAFARHNEVYFGDQWYNASNHTDAKTDISPDSEITPEKYISYLEEIFKMAREYDLFFMIVMRPGHSEIWREVLEGNQQGWDTPGGGIWDYNYIKEPDDGGVEGEILYHNLLDRICWLIQPFTDETAVMSWELFGEAAGSQWIYEYEYDPSPEFKRVADFFTSCSQFISDEVIYLQSSGITLPDKHLVSSGIWGFDYHGWYNRPHMKETKILGFKDGLFNYEYFIKYEDFIDFHDYGSTPQTHDINRNFNYSLERFYGNPDYFSIYEETPPYPYQNELCPPLFFGEVNPLRLMEDTKFAGYTRTYDSDSNPSRNWIWDVKVDDNLVECNSIMNDSELGTQVQTFDVEVKYIRQNYHYKNWKDWYGRLQTEDELTIEDKLTTEGLTNVLHYRDGEEHRKIGFTLWNLVNHGQPYVFQKKAGNAVFDLSERNELGEITGYDDTFYDGDHWWGIYLNEVKIYPFYMNLFRTDWSQR